MLYLSKASKTSSMETFVQTKSKYLAFSFTIGIHLLLILLFLLMGFVKPAEKSPVIETSCGGLGIIGFETLDLNDAVVGSKTSSSEKLISDPDEEFKMEQSTAVVKTEELVPSESIEYNAVLNKWKQLKNRKTQQGNTTGSDLREGNSFTNVSSGTEKNGTFILANRSLLVKPETILNDTEEGKVVVEIIVNEKGKVISAIAGQRGSTTTSTALYKKAVKSAYTAQFDPASDGIKEQRGTYTFVFTLE